MRLQERLCNFERFEEQVFTLVAFGRVREPPEVARRAVEIAVGEAHQRKTAALPAVFLRIAPLTFLICGERAGYPKVDTITWKPVVDSNSRAAVMQTGEAHFTFPVPYELDAVLRAKPELEVVAAPSIVLRYLSMNTTQKPFDNVKVRQAIAYAINKDALAKVAFNGYATPAEGVVAARRRIRRQDRRRGRTTSPRRRS